MIFIIILCIVIFDFILERWLDMLNAHHWSDSLPEELSSFYDAESYKKSMLYDRANQRLGLLSSVLSFVFILLVLLLDGFALLDGWVRQVTVRPVPMALLYFGTIGFISDLASIPFSAYNTFMIEEKFGFNKTTIRTFILDKLKGWLLALILGGGLVALVVWIFTLTADWFWLLAWVVVSVVMIFLNMFYSSLIVPLFNKQEPLPEGDLRSAIEDFCIKAGFQLKNIFVIDGSKRSSKANAYFSGLGAKKRIVLYDTLINDHTKEELVAILAHEIGHYKKKHTLAAMAMGIAQTGIMLFILSLFIGKPVLAEALGARDASFHIGVTAFGLLFTPISLLTGILMNMLSRKNEYAADRFAGNHYDTDALKTALIKLSVKHLSNLRPHPAYVFFHYSHPTLLQRLNKLNALQKNFKKSAITITYEQ